MENKKLRMAFVGVGGMGRKHVRFCSQNPSVEVVALCDLNPEKCANSIKDNNLNPNTPIYTDFREMIEKEQLDAVDIITPNYYHSVIAIFAFEHGLHVFCEKPDAINAEEAMKMKEASEKAGKVLMVMRNNRYYNNSKHLKTFIDAGKAGEIYCGRCGWVRRRGIPGKGGWFTTKALSGGGPLIDLGVHMIDLSIWLMGNPKPVAVSGCTYNKFAENESRADSEHAAFGEAQEDGIIDVEDLAMGFIRFENGACLQIEFSWSANIEKEKRFVELRGTKAGVYWNDDGTCSIWGEDEITEDPLDIFPHTGDMGNGHARALEHFVKIILDGAKPDYVPEQGVNMIKILDAIYKSAETGKEVIL
ncbi:MAG: Gfo/Idh/MocA family oxidoreductase [Ruminococcaceae bacterium]|nr:Gfo/Idh/MocA family oxidoreductase [Oscillospiraceae bacterium]